MTDEPIDAGMVDGADSLAQVLWGRNAKAADLVGGSNAAIFDAAVTALARQQRPENGEAAVERAARAIAEEFGFTHIDLYDPHHLRRCARAALATTPAASGETWRPDERTVEMCAAIADKRAGSRPEEPEDDYEFAQGFNYGCNVGAHNACCDVADAIRALSRDEASKEGGDRG